MHSKSAGKGDRAKRNMRRFISLRMRTSTSSRWSCATSEPSASPGKTLPTYRNRMINTLKNMLTAIAFDSINLKSDFKWIECIIKYLPVPNMMTPLA